MIQHCVIAPPPPELAAKLAVFEAQFVYPLGAERSFRISHGADYARFFRAIGDAACFVFENEQRVIGTIAVALRELILPSGAACTAAYLGDLKVAPEARGGRTLPRLMRAVQSWVGHRSSVGLCVVMDGTPVVPSRYTGRMGLPMFQELGRVSVLKLAATPGPSADCVEISGHEGRELYLRLVNGRYASPIVSPEIRSEVTPRWLALADGNACGLLEDTVKAKRLISNDGPAMNGAHLSCFATRTPDAGAALLRAAASRAADLNRDSVFVAVSAEEADALVSRLRGIQVIRAPATIFGCGLQAASGWHINTAEI